jgi:hypothetical protein
VDCAKNRQTLKVSLLFALSDKNVVTSMKFSEDDLGRCGCCRGHRRHLRRRRVRRPPAVMQGRRVDDHLGPILQNSILAEKSFDTFSSSISGQISTRTIILDFKAHFLKTNVLIIFCMCKLAEF